VTDCFRVQTSYSQNWPCWNIWHSRDRNKNVYIITGQLKLKHICAIFGGGDMTYYRPPCSRFWGDVSPLSPAGFTLLWLRIISHIYRRHAVCSAAFTDLTPTLQQL